MNKLCGRDFNQALGMLKLKSLLNHFMKIQHPEKSIVSQAFSQTDIGRYVRPASYTHRNHTISSTKMYRRILRTQCVCMLQVGVGWRYTCIWRPEATIPLRQGLSMNLKRTISTRLANQWTPRIYLSLARRAGVLSLPSHAWVSFCYCFEHWC